MDRLAFIAGVAGFLAAPFAAEAQVRKIPRVGMLFLATREGARPYITSFEGGMRTLGYVDGRNIVYEHRFANGKPELLPELATEMVRLKVDVIVTGLNEQTAAAKRATITIPIVMWLATQPVAAGFIAGLSRPGGNLTGLTADVDPEMLGKRLEILKEIVPRLRRVAVLQDPTAPGGELYRNAIQDAGRKLHVATERIEVRSRADFDGAFVTIKRQLPDGLMVGPGSVFAVSPTRLIELIANTRLPAVYGSRRDVELGGLASYGPNWPDQSRRAATYVDKILKGEKPADLPVEQPTTFELVINLKTAKALGLTIPPSLLARADQVIE